VVDEARLARLLRGVTDELSVLAAESSADEGRRSDPLWLRGIKYTFVSAIEGCIDAAQHVCSAEGWGPPADNGDAMRVLGRHGVLAASLAERMRQAVRFRNVLVHEYVDVDDEIVIARLSDHADLRDYVVALSALLLG
jgi:uncharacterized protein YutE (UPF0331/DUF86 family)